MCTAALLNLAPGAEAVLEEQITAEWQPGEYRMVTRVHLLDLGRGGEVFSQAFRVRS